MPSPLAHDLEQLRLQAEKAASPGRFAQRIHLMPPVGWLNDPNGLCQMTGTYHAFFQYAPFSAEGGTKMWGHSVSTDMLTWDYVGVPFYPDQPFDVSGVYSGSALVEDGQMNIFYTGNVKREDRLDYDYISSGRESHTVRTTSRDGASFTPRHVVLSNPDYPHDDTQHVRDPKVWKQHGRYFMALGARRKDDAGEVLIYSSADLETWELHDRVSTDEPFGYMWECPDYFELAADGAAAAAVTAGDGADAAVLKILSVSPQGLKGGAWDRRNIYQSGYFLLEGSLETHLVPQDFALWDAGFDFYAPQTFEAEDGRRILIGWMGVPDETTYTNKTIQDGWQHCFTMPREISVTDGRVTSWPIRELESLRTTHVGGREELELSGAHVFDLLVDDFSAKPDTVTITCAHELEIGWCNGEFYLRFADSSMAGVGAGRTERKECVGDIKNVRVIGDTSSIEVFVNDGVMVFSTRYYPEDYTISVHAPGAAINLWELERSAG
ncbi:MAG: glycoside hydrolase family 32 protein [Atopobiaceae bacterium]